jgi:hypothetical protein
LNENRQPDDGRRGLERVAYGQARTPEEVVAAAEARQALDRLDAEWVKHDAPLSSPPADDPEPEPPIVEVEPDAAPATARTTSSRWPLAVAVAAVTLILGIAIGHGLDTPPARPAVAKSTPVETAAGDPAATSRLAAGDPASVPSASDWFAGEQTAADRYPVPAPFDQFEEKSTRLIHSSPTIGDIWIAKNRKSSGGYCVISMSSPGADGSRSGADDCVTGAVFAKRGISFTSNGATVHWHGANISVDITPR